ncbi:MAG: M20 peptidase family dipeptidase [Candidimonas sp.]|nr:MAG: M20 peptidase family dipeptidase [Candidimonas sp.]
MSRDDAIAWVGDRFDSGEFKAILAERIAYPTESQNPERRDVLTDYLCSNLRPAFESMGFECRVLADSAGKASFLYAQRMERDELPTVLGYGHGDVVRGMAPAWSPGLEPWKLVERDGRWYGRGIADNKGQHSINMEALRAVLNARGRLGFNAKYLIEMGEETGSPGLADVCGRERNLLRADLLLASDGPRMSENQPLLFLGSRGCLNFDLSIDARPGGHHSGNWGGLISNPGIQLAHALASITSSTGQILIPEWVPDGIPASVSAALSACEIDAGTGGPRVEPGWGESGLTPAEKMSGWSSFEVLAFETGNPAMPVNAIPPRAWARCQLRYVVGVDPERILPALRRHLDRRGFAMVNVERTRDGFFRATRLNPEDPWVPWTLSSIATSSGKRPALLPSQGGSLPNDVFAESLGLRTLWVPHSYLGCSQHAPDEHLPVRLMREALGIMAGLYWDLGAGNTPAP